MCSLYMLMTIHELGNLVQQLYEVNNVRNYVKDQASTNNRKNEWMELAVMTLYYYCCIHLDPGRREFGFREIHRSTDSQIQFGSEFNEYTGKVTLNTFNTCNFIGFAIALFSFCSSTLFNYCWFECSMVLTTLTAMSGFRSNFCNLFSWWSLHEMEMHVSFDFMNVQ